MAEGGSPLGSLLSTTPNPNISNVMTCQEKIAESDGVNWEGLAAIIIFYLAVLMVGLWAGWKTRKKEANTEQVMLAGRDIGLGVGVLTMGATWVGGGFINGSAQETYKDGGGLIWTQAPFGYSMALIIAGTFYARKMREAEYVTMIDPFTQKYGKWGALQAIPAAISEIFWSASILGALGSTLQVILNLNEVVSIASSAVIALGYTLLGGLISVAYTDVIQIFFIVFGLFLALPFALTSEFVDDIYKDKLDDGVTPAWYGKVEPQDVGLWVDYWFLLVFGGIPWQCYYQRVLSSKTANRAMFLSYGGAAIALIMTGPSVLFGAIAKNTDWTAAGYLCGAPTDKCNEGDLGYPVCTDHTPTKVVLPLALQYLTPKAVAFFGLGAVSAAVMSSTDSSMLSASTMIARNFYQKVIRPNCSEKEVIWALWVCIIINCVIATLLAITYRSIYDLFVLCGDFMFVIVFPQLTLVLYWELANTYGSVFSFFVGLLLRLLCGDKTMGIPAAIEFGKVYAACPTVDDPDKMCEGPMPFRLFVTLIGAAVHVVISYIAYFVFTRRKVGLKHDFFGAFKEDRNGSVVLASSRHMKEEYEMNMTIPRAKVSMTGEGMTAYENNGYK
jgi:high affinity choline transporter 7